jgi:hypothetical protein
VAAIVCWVGDKEEVGEARNLETMGGGDGGDLQRVVGGPDILGLPWPLQF